ncbi:MAG TPA: tRNA (guanosine(37)-N1)-methyltransferase TrmD [Alphaproteobacteria bacterium]|nr:tRNA (guanosine(37)-N1)-methyltransferase TrmD [Alphaproteobacteria bacterium]
MKVKILTLYPEIFPGFLGFSLTGKALAEGKWSFEVINIRDYATDKYGSVDDTPCGGGAGMVMRADILGSAIDANFKAGKLIYMTPKGKPLTQAKLHELAKEPELTIVCNRFEGIDERVVEVYHPDEISIGDYVLTGGEQAAMIMLDGVIRLLDGVLGNNESAQDESFENGLLEYPQYTRPIDWKGMKVPDVLLSGHHANIEKWRKEQSLKVTQEKRPDLFKKYLDLKKV